ncbi:MAG: DMT family transporter [Nitrospirae bacterium]|nr:DMT family transporter [Nitrospirota bacterium]
MTPPLLHNGPLLMLGSTGLFALLAVATKLASATLPIGEITSIRFLSGCLFVLGLIGLGWIRLRRGNVKLLLARGIYGGLAVIFYFLSIATGTISHATLLTYSQPVFATLFAWVIYKERAGLGTLLAGVAALVGILLILNPVFDALRLSDLYGLLAGLFSGAAIVTIRELRKTDSSWVIFFYFHLVGLLLAAPLLLGGMTIPRSAAWLWLGGVVCFSIGGQLVMTYAYKFCTASEGGVIALTTVILATALGILFLGETPSAHFYLGGTLVLGSSAYLTLRGPLLRRLEGENGTNRTA